MRSLPRVVATVVGLALMVVACSSGLTLREYATEVEALVAEMDAALLALNEKMQAVEPTFDQLPAFLGREVDIVVEFVTDFRRLEPPPAAEELHSTALRVLDRRIEAGRAVAAEIAAAEISEDGDDFYELLSELQQSEALAEFIEADEQVLDLCLAAEATFNTTEEDAKLAGLPWVPAELKDVVQVTLNCGAVPE